MFFTQSILLKTTSKSQITLRDDGISLKISRDTRTSGTERTLVRSAPWGLLLGVKEYAGVIHYGYLLALGIKSQSISLDLETGLTDWGVGGLFELNDYKHNYLSCWGLSLTTTTLHAHRSKNEKPRAM